jgi:hypothetical protein
MRVDNPDGGNLAMYSHGQGFSVRPRISVSKTAPSTSVQESFTFYAGALLGKVTFARIVETWQSDFLGKVTLL